MRATRWRWLPLAAAILAGCCAAWSASGQPDDGQQYAETTEPDGQRPTSRSPLPIEQKPDSDWSKPECGKPSSHDEADLCQQRRMAESAEEAVTLSRVQTGLGVAGAVALFVTLYLTWRSAVAARDAANASVDAVRLSRRLSRPRLDDLVLVSDRPVRDARSGEADDDVTIPIRASVKNVGASAAFIEAIAIDHVVKPAETAIVGGQCDEALYDRERIPSEARHEWELPIHWISMTEPERRAVVAGTMQFVVFGHIRYSDLAGTNWVFGFLFVLSPSTWSAGQDQFYPVRPSLDWYDREETEGQNTKRRPRER